MGLALTKWGRVGADEFRNHDYRSCQPRPTARGSRAGHATGMPNAAPCVNAVGGGAPEARR